MFCVYCTSTSRWGKVPQQIHNVQKLTMIEHIYAALPRFFSNPAQKKSAPILLLAQLNRELSAGDKSLHTASLNLEIAFGPGLPPGLR